MIPPEVRAQLLRNARSLGLLAVGAFVALTLGFLQLLGAVDQRVSGENEAVPDFTATPPAQASAVALDGGAGDPSSAPVGSDGRSEAAPGTGDVAGGSADAPLTALSDAATTDDGGADAPPMAVASPLAGWQTYADTEHGIALSLPDGWRQAQPLPNSDLAARLPDHDVVFESPDAVQRLAISTWDAAERPPFTEFVSTVVAGMQPVDGLWPTNAFIAGEPALIVGAPEAPTTPLAYAAYLEHADRYYRIAWSAYDGARDTTVFARALATLAWSAAASPSGLPGPLAPDAWAGPARPGDAPMVPRLDLPAGVYYPSEALFGIEAP